MRVITAPTNPAALRDPKAIAGVTVAVVALLAVFTLAGLLVRSPTFVDHLTIVNGTHYDLNLAVSDSSGSGAVLLPPVQPLETVRVEDVVDQGSSWRFDVSRGGESVDTLQFTRGQLEHQGWRISLPASLDQTLQERGRQAPPSPH